MPEISLHEYESQINQSIEQARYLEALAHIRHILTQHPHYVGAYYLLGMTMFEADLIELAADMFRRALSADPEHLMSRVGLGLAHERRGDLDAAIWNLERALELEPGSADIAEELRRMYGRRDAEEPEYIPQTRAGLARLYLRGHRFGRAADELRTLLAEDEARPDLLTALAEAYWRNDQLVQAAEVCQQILDKMPYNCKANLLLGTLWVNSGQEEGWLYLNRAEEVDLENRLADELFGADSLLEPAEVTIDRLVYDPDAIDVDRSSAWFKRLESASITVGISEAPPEMTESEVRLVDITAGLESQIEIPDWLRDLGGPEEGEEGEGALGWMAEVGYEEPAGAPPAEAESSEEVSVEGAGEDTFGFAEPPAEEIEEEVPDWVSELMPSETALDRGESDVAPDWLQELVSEEEAAEAGAAAPAEVAGDLDWLGDLAAEEEAAPAAEEAVAPDWLDQLGIEDEVAPTEEPGTDWVADLAVAFPEEEAPVDIEEEAAVESPDWSADSPTGAEAEEAEVGEGIPDWLADLQPAEEAGTPVAAEAASDEVPDWLADLAPAGGEEEVETLELPQEGMPDWLTELQEEAGEEAPEAPPSDEQALADALGLVEEGGEEEVPDWLRDLEPGAVTAAETAAETETTEGVEEVPDWLRALKPEELGAEETAAASEAEAPDWLIFEEETSEGAAAGEPEAATLVTPEAETVLEPESTTIVEPEMAEIAPQVPEVSEEEPGVLSGEDALAWLESLAVGKEDELRAQAEAESAARVDEILGRRREEPEAAVAEPEPVPEAPEPEVEEEAAGSGDETLAWLESLAAETPPGETVVAEAESLAQERAPEPEAGMPVAEEMAEAPAVSETESDVLSGDDALAWLEGLTVGKEDELRAQAEVESAARVDEILGRRREPEAAAETEVSPTEVAAEVEAVEAEPPVAEEPAEAPVITEEEGELLSGDDALAWLESLTIGKEDELRAQAEAESEARVDEILGRRRETEAAAEAEVPSPEMASETEAAAAPAISEEEGELLSGDDALAWLESLTIGKEDELRAQAEAESVARVDEILGRRREAPAPSPEVGAVGEPEAPAAAEAEAVPAESEPAGEAYFGWSAFGEGATEVAEAAPTPEEPAVEPALEPALEPADETAVEGEEAVEAALSGEDALAWLESLTPEKEAALQAQVGAGPAAETQPPSEAEAEYFGWSGFGETPEEVPTPAAAAEADLPAGEAPEAAAEPEVAAAEPEPAARAAETPVGDEATPELEAVPEPEVAEEEAGTVEAPAVESAVSEPEPAPEVEVEPVAAEPEVASADEGAPTGEGAPVAREAPEEAAPAQVESEPAVTEPVPAEPAAKEPEAAPKAAEPAATEEELDLDALRARVKQKRSDHASRLILARGLWEAGEIQESMEHYARLIKAGTKSDEVQEDLRRYVYERPAESRVLRTLGDFLMKNGDLDEALAIYNQAMELL